LVPPKEENAAVDNKEIKIEIEGKGDHMSSHSSFSSSSSHKD
jgi:hypothetical protein